MSFGLILIVFIAGFASALLMVWFIEKRADNRKK